MKYIGSKQKLAKDIVPILQKLINDNNIKAYIEPFVGGANLIDKVKCNKRIGGDINPYLIELLRDTRDFKIDFPTEVTREHYLDVKNDYLLNGNKYSNTYKGCVGFLSAFRGKFFDSYAGHNYESQGKVRNNYIESKKNLIKQAPLLKGIEFYCMPYNELPITNKSLIYCDIPYKDTYGYNVSFDHEAFYKWCKEMADKGHIVVISEYDMPNEFECIWSKSVKVCLMAQSDRNVKVEKLFIYRGNK